MEKACRFRAIQGICSLISPRVCWSLTFLPGDHAFLPGKVGAGSHTSVTLLKIISAHLPQNGVGKCFRIGCPESRQRGPDRVIQIRRLFFIMHRPRWFHQLSVSVRSLLERGKYSVDSSGAISGEAGLVTLGRPECNCLYLVIDAQFLQNTPDLNPFSCICGGRRPVVDCGIKVLESHFRELAQFFQAVVPLLSGVLIRYR